MSPKFCHNHQPLWICSLRIDVEDLGTDKYYSIAEEIGRRVSSAAGSPTATQTLGLVACGVGVSIFANKFPGVFAATCLSAGDAFNARSINNSNRKDALTAVYTVNRVLSPTICNPTPYDRLYGSSPDYRLLKNADFKMCQGSKDSEMPFSSERADVTRPRAREC
ncbi:hypothetical protein RJ640_010898 [Escallonia rubra]|uniref:Uncharacterized protein n=1 Tax=Escallonia rubra TaxID=112253 RepID=A0AA88UDY1_9ASTE|nr:hypothetical protein RJ640_010898 [Escallonia rubra]